MDVMQAINNRRSIRRFRQDKLSRDLIYTILEAGIKAPSGKNKQPWEFVVVTGDNELKWFRL